MEDLQRRELPNHLKVIRSSPREIPLSNNSKLSSQSKSKLAESTKGLYIKRVKSSRMYGGIFELIQYKRRMDALEVEVPVSVHEMSGLEQSDLN